MVDPISTSTVRTVAAAPARAAASGAFPAIAEEAKVEDVPAAPPPEVLDALDRAARVLDELAAKQVSLRFKVTEDDEVRVEVRDGEGHVVRRIPAERVLELLDGTPDPLLP